ncbi:MAG: hypothetical protein ACRCYY_13405 [Trueperaceae bacterium]
MHLTRIRLKGFIWLLILLCCVIGLLVGCGTAQKTTDDIEAEVYKPVTNDINDFENFEPVMNGKTYYVSGEGNDANDGLNPETAFRTLQKAADLTNPGDTVLAMNGTYTRPEPGGDVLKITRAGTPDAFIAYKAMKGHKPHIFVGDNYTGIVTFVPYILIEGFTVEGNIPNLSYEEAYSIALSTNIDAIEKNVRIRYSASGIRSFPKDGFTPHHIIMRKNTVFNLPAGGLSANATDYVRIDDNVVYNTSSLTFNATSGISFYQTRDIDDKTGTKIFVRRNTVYNNENLLPFYYSNSDPAQRSISDGNGIIIDDTRNGQEIFGEPGPAYKGTFLIENNLVFNNGGRGLSIYQSDNVIARSNTFYHNARTPNDGEIPFSGQNSELLFGRTTNVHLYGNIVVTEPTRKVIFRYEEVNIKLENNLFSGGAELPDFPENPSDNPLPNIVGKGPNFVNPTVDPATANFRLKWPSLAINSFINTPTNQPPKTDITGKKRPTVTVDLGAYEYSPY